MRDTLDRVIQAYGGLRRWTAVTAVSAHLRMAGSLWVIKDVADDAVAGEVTVWVKEQRTRLRPFTASELRSCYTRDRVSIETLDGDLVEVGTDLRSSFAGHGLRTPWTALQLAHFTGYALWTYLSEPLHLTLPGVQIVEGGRWREGRESLRQLHVRYPGTVTTHSVAQTIYVDFDGLIRRRDYAIDIAGGFPAVQYLSDFRETSGIVVPGTRRIYARGGTHRALLDEPLVSLELSDIRVL